MSKPDFRIYKIETTKYWRSDIARKAGQLFGVYIFDANRHIHCAATQPSYEMNYLGATWTGGLDQDSEAERDRLDEQIREGDSETDRVMYVLVSSVNLDQCEVRLVTDEEWAVYLSDTDGDEEEAYKAALQKESEHCICNGWVG